MLILDDEQEALVQRLLEEPTRAALNASDPGTGKTVSTVEFIKRAGFQQVLLIVPINVFSSWKSTFAGQGVTLPWRPITKANDPENYKRLRGGQPGIYVVGPEQFARLSVSIAATDKKPEVKAPWPECWKKVTPELIVYDEGHKGMTSKKTSRFKALSQLNRKGYEPYKLILSGTPQGSKFTGAHAPTYWLWPDKVDKSRYLWEATWCSFEFNPHTFNSKMATGERRPGAFFKSLPCVVKIEAKSLPTDVTEIRVDLTPEQRKMWDEMAKKSVAWLGENSDQPEVAELPIVQRIRLRQMALGEVTFNEDGEIDFPPSCASGKLKAAQWILDKHRGEKVLFVTDSKKFAKVAAERLGGKAWIGETKKEQREEMRQDMPDVLVATYAAIGEGTDGLQTQCSVEVIFNVSDSAVLNTQFAGRLNRRGQKANKITRYEIIARDTLDDDHFGHMVSELAQRKKEVEL